MPTFFGTYQFTLNQDAPPNMETGTATRTSSAYPGAIPALTAANVAALSSITASDDFTFIFSGFTPNAQAETARTILLLFDLTAGNVEVFNSGDLAASATMVTVPGSLFVAGNSYRFNLIYSNVDQIGFETPGVSASIVFENRVLGDFVVSQQVPTPAPAAMALLGLGTVALALRRTTLAGALMR